MSDLTIGWTVVRVGDVVALNPKNDAQDQTEAGFSPMQLLGTEFRSSVGFEARLWGEIKKSYTHFANGDVLLAKITPCFENGKAGLVAGMPNGIGAGSSEYFVCRPEPGVLEAKYLLAHFKTDLFIRSGAVEMTGSVGHKRVPKDYLLNSQLSLPPIREQKRIADKLDAVLARVDACRERLDCLPGILKRFRQSVLTAATSGKLTDEWRGECGFESDWASVQLATVAEDFSYGTSAKSALTGDVPVLRMGNIQSGRLDWSSLAYTSDAREIAKYKLAPGDVLFNRTNSPELVGKTAVYLGERAAVYAGYLIRVRCSATLNPRYLSYCLESPEGRDYCWRVKSDGVSQSNINAKKLAAFVLPLPSADEQAEIVRRVESLFSWADRLEARYAAALAQVERLTPSLLAKAFRGELVPQDPADEPAAKLLERMLQQHPTNSTAPTKRQVVTPTRAKALRAASNVREESPS